MARSCSVCTHPQWEQIDRKLIELKPFRELAEQYGLSKSALSRHARAHPLNSRGVVRRGNRRAGIYRARCPYCGAESRMWFSCYDCQNGCPTVRYGQEPTGTKREDSMKKAKVVILHGKGFTKRR